MRTYRINEIFYSLQGEGMRAGEASFFLRFSGCNLRCTKESVGFDCDTEFRSGLDMKLEDILLRMQKLNHQCKWIVLTGGEPSLQIDDDLIDFFHKKGFKLAIESNGTHPISEKIDWITISPKTAEHTLKQKRANELKYVRAYGQGIPKPSIKAEHYLISPAFEGDRLDRKTLNWCIQLAQDNPPWKLSLQQHKLWKIK